MMSTRRRDGSLLLGGWAVLSLAALVALAVWQGDSYWEYSDGVYALTSRQVLDGLSLYRDFAAAQPPSLFYLGAAVLAVDDSLTAIRVAMAACGLGVSLLVLCAVWRVTRRRDAALIAALASFVTPWALREHAQFLPETVAAPLLMGATLAAGRRATAPLAGALGALAASFKLALLLPALAIVLLGRHVRRGSVALGATCLAIALLFALAFGDPLWTNVVVAQEQAGRASLAYVSGLWAQGGWNALPMLCLAAVAVRHRDRLHDPDLVRSLLAACGGSLLMLAALFKQGSWLTVMVLVEPPLLCLAACGVVILVSGTAQGERRPRARAAAAGAAVLLTLGQSASLLISPDDPSFFTRPRASSTPSRTLSSRRVRADARAIRGCPAGTSYAGAPYLAFVAHRRIAGSQPDQFIIHRAAALAGFAQSADADPAICGPIRPPQPP